MVSPSRSSTGAVGTMTPACAAHGVQLADKWVEAETIERAGQREKV
jgi:hypothetical protein